MNETNKVKQFFNKAAKSYDYHCQLQQKVGEVLICLTKQETSDTIPAIIDVGCGTGIVTEKVATEFHHTVFHATDIATALLAIAKQRLTPLDAQVYEYDFNQLPATRSQFDLVFSNMALQWSQNLSQTFQMIRSLLSEKGKLAFSIPLSGTLNELKHTHSLNQFYSMETIIQLLAENQYDILVSNSEIITLSFDTLIAALKSIKQVGANYTGRKLKPGLRGKSLLKVRMAQRLTYVIGYFVVQGSNPNSVMPATRSLHDQDTTLGYAHASPRLPQST